MSNTTHFGFKTVPEEEKSTLVRGVFDAVASRYDVMNDLMSGGLHRWWKHEMVAWLNPQAGMKILDVAGGTGDIAFRILKRAACDITICDINRQMLDEGRNRAIDRNILPSPSPLVGEGGVGGNSPQNQASSMLNHSPLPNPPPQGGRGTINWLCANAESLPLPDAAFDAYTIAFGIRNVTHIDLALAEAWRVLKPGGRFLCLEFSHINPPPPFRGRVGVGVSGNTTEDNPLLNPPPERGRKYIIQKCYDAYSFHVIPKIGEWVTGNGDPYKYLVESIRQFPTQEDFAKMIRAAGLGNVQYRNMAQGVVAIHSGRKL